MIAASRFALPLSRLLDRLETALVQLEHSDDHRITPRQRIDLAWASEHLRSLGACCHASALQTTSDSLTDWLGRAGSTSRELLAALDRVDHRDLLDEVETLRAVVDEVTALVSAIEANA